MGSLSQADRQVINGLYNFVLDRNVARAANVTTNATTNATTNSTGNITNSTSANTTSGNSTNNGTRPNNQTNNNCTKPSNQTNNTNSTGNNSTNNNTGNNTNANNTNTNATNNTNNTVPPQVQDIVSVRSGVLSFENDPTDYMVNITNPRNWIKPVRANFTAGQVDDLTATVLFQSAFLVRGGLASGRFGLNDRLTNYVLTVDAFNANGTQGSGQVNFGTL